MPLPPELRAHFLDAFGPAPCIEQVDYYLSHMLTAEIFFAFERLLHHTATRCVPTPKVI